MYILFPAAVAPATTCLGLIPPPPHQGLSLYCTVCVPKDLNNNPIGSRQQELDSRICGLIWSHRATESLHRVESTRYHTHKSHSCILFHFSFFFFFLLFSFSTCINRQFCVCGVCPCLAADEATRERWWRPRSSWDDENKSLATAWDCVWRSGFFFSPPFFSVFFFFFLLLLFLWWIYGELRWSLRSVQCCCDALIVALFQIPF